MNNTNKTEYKVELANKIRNGRAVGNLWGVAQYVDGRRGSFVFDPQGDEDAARKVASRLNDEAAGPMPSCSSPDGHEDNGTGECTHCGLLR